MLTFDEGDELFDFESEKIKLVEPDQDFSVEVNCDEDQLIDEAAGKSTEKKTEMEIMNSSLIILR